MKVMKFPLQPVVHKLICDCRNEMKYVPRSKSKEAELNLLHECGCGKTVIKEIAYPHITYEQSSCVGEDVK